MYVYYVCMYILCMYIYYVCILCMYVCVCICVYVCICMHVRIMYVCMYVCIMYVCMYMCVCMYVCTYVCMCVCMHVCIMYVYVCVHVHIVYVLYMYVCSYIRRSLECPTPSEVSDDWRLFFGGAKFFNIIFNEKGIFKSFRALRRPDGTNFNRRCVGMRTRPPPARHVCRPSARNAIRRVHSRCICGN